MKQLQALNVPELEELHQLFKQEWPKYCLEVYTLHFFIDFLKGNHSTKHFRAYTLGGQQLGLFLIVDRYQLFVGCLESENSQVLLEQALRQLDWSRGLQCSSMCSRYWSAVTKVIQEKDLPIDFKNSTSLRYLPREAALSLPVDTPAGFYLKSLAVEDAQIMDDLWKWSHPGSLYLIQRQILLSPSVGLYKEDTNEMVAWCIRTQDGLLSTLFVKDSYKRRGFGILVASELARRIAQLGQDITAEVDSVNMVSGSLFHKLGFQVIDQSLWVVTKPTIKDFIWPDGE